MPGAAIASVTNTLPCPRNLVQPSKIRTDFCRMSAHSKWKPCRIRAEFRKEYGSSCVGTAWDSHNWFVIVDEAPDDEVVVIDSVERAYWVLENVALTVI